MIVVRKGVILVVKEEEDTCEEGIQSGGITVLSGKPLMHFRQL